jgi:hypothetical protein
MGYDAVILKVYGHPKSLWTSFPLDLGSAQVEEFGRLVMGMLARVDPQEPDYFKIQRRHADSIVAWLASGKQIEDCKTGINESLFDNILMPTNQLLYLLYSTTQRSVESVQEALRPHFRNYVLFMNQHQPTGRTAVAGWGLEKYLDVLDSFLLISRIKPPDAPWGKLMFKCLCKYCYVHTCCGDSLVWSMILNLA